MATPEWELEGTWEEIAAHATELAGRRVRLTVLGGNEQEPRAPHRPNEALLAAMEKVGEMQKGMNPAEAGDTLALLREARSGAMYDFEASE